MTRDKLYDDIKLLELIAYNLNESIIYDILSVEDRDLLEYDLIWVHIELEKLYEIRGWVY